jgi:hypothetical protein
MTEQFSKQFGGTSVDAICDRMLRRFKSGDAGAALQGISEFVADVISRESSLARVFSSRNLDMACLKIGDELCGSAGSDPAADRSDCVVFIVTHLAKTGGHSRVLADLMDAEPTKKYRILASNLFNDLEVEAIKRLYPSQSLVVEVAADTDYGSRVRWLQARLAEIRPRKTYMLIHNIDTVAVAAVQPRLTGELVYYHNCDHSLALGVHIPHALHVDPHAKGFYNCRERERVPSNFMWPLTAPDQGHRTNLPFLAHGHLTTCTSGGPEKFGLSNRRERLSYAYRYEELIPHIIGATGGTHIHIGKLPPEMLSAISHGLKNIDISEERFLHIDYVPSLWQTLLGHKVDVYVGSFPLGGGRASIEAMGAGLPLLIHSNYRSCFLSDANEVYPAALIWDKPGVLFEHIAKLNNMETLRHHSEMARAFYEANHGQSRLRDAVVGANGHDSIAPRRPSFVGDSLQQYLDENSASFARWFKRKGKKRTLSQVIRQLKRRVGLL